MNGEIQVKNGIKPTEWKRPAWIYVRPNSDGTGATMDLSNLEMLESIRNVLEDVKNSQMLQCDVRGAIIRMSRAVERIDKRLAKLENLKLKK